MRFPLFIAPACPFAEYQLDAFVFRREIRLSLRPEPLFNRVLMQGVQVKTVSVVTIRYNQVAVTVTDRNLYGSHIAVSAGMLTGILKKILQDASQPSPVRGRFEYSRYIIGNFDLRI